jgi:dTMP kinase
MKQFITFEGIDGSGKSTISKLVCKKLQLEGYHPVLTYEPTDTNIGHFVQKSIKTNSDPFVTAFAFILDRMQHCVQIKKWLDEGKIVLCDRYADSTYAYQGSQLEDQIENPIEWLQDLSKKHIIKPERTFLFLIEPKKSLKRIQKRNELIPFEQVSFLKKVYTYYLHLSQDKRFLKLDATKKIDELVNICYEDIIL